MSKRFLLGLFLAGLLVVTAAALLERAPGYMDADFYYAGALRLANGQGSSEPYLWNYLNDSSGLPAPAFSYWMPLISLVASAGLALARPLGWWGARLGFLLLAACIPPLTALLAQRLTERSASARLAGLLALFPGFYLAYLPTTDAFALYMVLGALFLLLAFDRRPLPRWVPLEARLFALGLLAGLLHMTRADGLLWLVGAAAAAWMAFRMYRAEGKDLPTIRLGSFGLAVVLGYLLVTFPWYLRNLNEWGSLMPPGGARALWITEYEQTMIYPASLLTPAHWLDAGLGSHLRAWGSALSNNLQTILAVQGGVVLLPFILAGMWKLRACPEVRLGGGMWLLTAAAMTVVFPFAGGFGGFFHSGSALQPLLWAVVPVGVESIMLWYAAKRRIGQPLGMVRFMSALLVGVAVLLTGVLYVQRVVGSEPGIKWNSSANHYQMVEDELVKLGAQDGEAVLVNNPPGYWLASFRPAAVIPYGDEQMLLAAARRVDARYLVLEVTNPWQLADLYHARVEPAELEFLSAVGTTRLYKIHLK